MDILLTNTLSKKNSNNEIYFEVPKNTFRESCLSVYDKGKAILRLMFANDERIIDCLYRIYAVFSVPGFDRFVIVVTTVAPDDMVFQSLTADMPSAHWYEREIRDMFGIVPEGHPDGRRLVFHNAFPMESHPLRKDWSITAEDLKEWGEGRADKSGDKFMKVTGEGLYEIPVGPVHAGVIEPGHFRFSAVGETIFFLEPRLFYKHKGIEKQFEKIGFEKGVLLAERVSGTSSFSHGVAYCSAYERMSGIEVSEKALAVRTLLIELERIYNHIGDIGNMCAGTSLQVGYYKGALIKERLQQLNARLTGSRFLRGALRLGGVNKNVFEMADDILSSLEVVTLEYKDMMNMLSDAISHIDRLENTGKLSMDLAGKFGVTGIAGRASGLTDDMRKSHPHLLYDRLEFEVHTKLKGDVFARMMVRAEETECSISMVYSLLESSYNGELTTPLGAILPYASALGYAESPRGSVFYWLMSDDTGNPFRVKMRSPSYCNWPAVPFAVHGNIVPDFPLCNKSFNLSYSGCDL